MGQENIKIIQKPSGNEVICKGSGGQSVTLAAKFGDKAEMYALVLRGGKSPDTSYLHQVIVRDPQTGLICMPADRIPNCELLASPQELSRAMQEADFEAPKIVQDI